MSFVVREIVPGFVAQIDNFPFQSFDRQMIGEARALWVKYPVLRFRKARMSDAEQIAFTKALGPIFLSRQVRHGQHDSFSEILVIANKKRADGTPAGELGDGEVMWHTDHWWIEVPPSAALLRALEVPPSGGNTYFANMYAAYAGLPESTKARMHGLQIRHQDVLDSYGDLRKDRQRPTSDDFASWPGVNHPIVRRHGDSGKPCLYVGAGRKWQAILGMRQEEASELLDEVWHHALRPEYQWYQEWQVDDMIMWDNRCLMHRRDQFDPSSTRLMHRTTVEGERPVAAL
jgi:alpha-ketoglutarate-dependent taurine dioxygenase